MSVWAVFYALSLSHGAFAALPAGNLLNRSAIAALPAGELVARIQDVDRDYQEASQSPDPAAQLRVQERVAETLALASQSPNSRAQRREQEAHAAPSHAPALRKLQTRILERAPALEIHRACESLVDALIEEAKLAVAPPAFPNLRHGERIFASACAACHGATETAKLLNPPPTPLRDWPTMLTVSPFRIYMAVRHGIAGTAMPAFDVLSDSEVWAVAFYVTASRQGRCDAPGARAFMKDLGRLSDHDLISRGELDDLACLRREGRRSSKPLNAATSGR